MSITGETELILYRGLSLDESHANSIQSNGFDPRFACHQEELIFSKDDIDQILSSDDKITLKNTRNKNNKEQKIYFACATVRDACFYALRNMHGGYMVQNGALKLSEECIGEKKPYVIKFKAFLEDVYIDGTDSLLKMIQTPFNWKDERYDCLCSLFSKTIVDKYLPLLSNEDSYNNKMAIADLMMAENEAILSFYYNKDILIQGSVGIDLLSSFRVLSQIGAENILEVREMTEEECEKSVTSFQPAQTMKAFQGS